jgi:type I restriction enzyme M protein
MTVSALTPSLRQLWDKFWASGVSNPLVAIEQISYLIFLRRLEHLDDKEKLAAKREGKRYPSVFSRHKNCRWSVLRSIRSDRLLPHFRDKVFPFLKGLPTKGNTFASAMRDAVFTIRKPSLLAEAIKILDELPLRDEDRDAAGDVYEELLGELNLSGRNGQFRTPRHVIERVVELADPSRQETVCDPAAGTAGFLVAAYSWAKKKAGGRRSLVSDADYVGYEFDATMVRLGLMNMMLHGIRDPQLIYQDALARSAQPLPQYDVILANPPFAGTVDIKGIDQTRFTLDTSKTELLYVENCLRLLNPKGRAAVIVPEGVLFSTTRAHVSLRKQLINDNTLEAIVSLPAGCFKPYTGVKTAILYFKRGGSTDSVWFYRVTGDGFTLDDRRERDTANDDLKYMPEAFRLMVRRNGSAWSSREARAAAERQSWVASRKQIEEREFELLPSAYEPLSANEIVHQKPAKLIGEIREAQQSIAKGLDRLEAFLQERHATQR